MSPAEDARFEALLDYLKRSRGFDFRGYKRSSLMRRVQKRVEAVSVKHFGEYQDFLEVHPEEFPQLFNTILINVTSFFRDETAWDSLAREFVPRILAAKQARQPIRVWDAGCASGEEAYTLAIVLCETLGPEKFQERVKIYATDVDEDALAQARHASYTAKQLEGLRPRLRQRYFDAVKDRFVFKADLRRSMIFGRHDLIQDAPISRLDLLACRNMLMYLNAETQARILARFHFALNDNGFLFLGKAEMLLTHAGLFQPVDLKGRVFTKTAKADTRERLLLLAQTGDLETVDNLGRHVRLREIALDANSVAQIVVDANGILALVNEQARQVFGLGQRDVGRALQDLEISYRPVELRLLIDQAYDQRQHIRQGGIKKQVGDDDVHYFDLQVTPLYDDGAALGVNVCFTDVSGHRRLEEDLRRLQQDLETSNQELQSAQEELETTNEELQSSNEELETTNEELQSNNEELETMNEELQSTNDELQTLNDELRQRTSEIDRTNSLFRSVLGQVWVGTVVVDQSLNIILWNSRAEDLWGVRSDEALGQPFTRLDVGLPIEPLLGPIRRCLEGATQAQEMLLKAKNRRGQSIECFVSCTPLLDEQKNSPGVLLLMGDVRFIEGKFGGQDGKTTADKASRA